MINYDSLDTQFNDARAVWDAADPFPYCQFENFLAGDMAERIATGFPETLERTGKDLRAEKKHKDVKLKTGTTNTAIMTGEQRQFFTDIMSPGFISYLEKLTGIVPLYPDEDLSGGGLHEIYTGGYLNVHADFNFHPKNHKLRALNLIVYLNPEWKEEWNGQLELWPEHLDSDPVKIAPLMNRAALFRTSETSWHGHPRPLETPGDISRRSLAVYYYTDWPEGLEQRAKTLYVLTPEQKADLRADLLAAWDGISSEEEAFEAAQRYQPRHVRQVYRELLAERRAP